MKGNKIVKKETAIKPRDDASERIRIFKLLLSHMSQGFSVDSFPLIAKSTVLRYLQVFPEEFVMKEYEAAHRRGQLAWERIGHKQATGKCSGSSRSWYYNMANRYGWRERIDVESSHKADITVSVVNFSSPGISNQSRELPAIEASVTAGTKTEIVDDCIQVDCEMA